MNTNRTTLKIRLNPGAEWALKHFPQQDESKSWALDHLSALIPPRHAARDPLNEMCTLLNSAAPLKTALALLRSEIIRCLDDDPLPIHILDSPDRLALFRDTHGIRGSWHEPDEQNITTRVTIGSFGNSFGEPHYLEQWVFFYDTSNDDSGPFPIAAANLANLCAWATGFQG